MGTSLDLVAPSPPAFLRLRRRVAVARARGSRLLRAPLERRLPELHELALGDVPQVALKRHELVVAEEANDFAPRVFRRARELIEESRRRHGGVQRRQKRS